MDLNPLYRGDTREYSLIFTNGNGVAIDISNWKIFFTLKKHESDSDDEAALKKDVTDHEAPLEGKTKFTLESSDTDGLQPTNYFYDVQAKKANGDIVTVVKGRFQVLIDITRRTT